MRVALAWLGMVAICGAGCDRAEIDRLLGDLPTEGQGGAPVMAAPGTGGAPAAGGAPATGGAPAMGAGGAAGHPSGCCFSPHPKGGASGTSSGTGGAGSMPGTGGAGSMPGTGGAPADGGQPTACSGFTPGSALTLAPAAAGQAYVRCGTLGPENGWDVTPSPSGDRLAARTAAGTVRLISTTTWTEVAQLASPVGQMDALAFSPDGTRLATLSAEMGQVTLWRTQDGTAQASYQGPPASTIDTVASSLAFSSDGRRLATSLGTVIDLTTGVSTSWKTGAVDTTALTTNPENNHDIDQGGIPELRFTAGDAKLFVVTRFQIGNSPTSIRLELRDPSTGAQTLLFSAYDRALLGYTISDDGRYVALAGTAEAATSAGLYHAGLTVVDATLGTQVAADPTSTATVLAFTRNGARLFTRTGDTVAVVGTTNLQPLTSFTLPSGAVFVGVTPEDTLAASNGGTTAFYQAATGAVVQSFSFPTTSIRWTANGRFAVGNGDPAALFHFWREADATALCAPAAQTGSAPAISTLGTTIPPVAGTGSSSTTSADGSVTATESYVIHGHSTSFYAAAITDTASGALLRQFGAAGGALADAPLALSVPSGNKAYTPIFTPMAAPTSDVAVWCR